MNEQKDNYQVTVQEAGNFYGHGVLSFFSSSWGEQEPSDIKYRVYLAQKGGNLNEYTFKLIEAKGNVSNKLRTIRETTFLSPSGLLLKGEEIARSYLETGHFPKIQIFDEFCQTGYEFSCLVYRLERIVYDYLNAHGSDLNCDSFSHYRIRSRFLDAIELHAYVCDAQQSLLEIDLKKQISSREFVYADEWLPYMVSVSRLITKSPFVENTSFIPTFRLKKDTETSYFHSLQKAGWLPIRWNNNEQSIDEREDAYGKCRLLQKSFASDNNEIYLHCSLRSFCYNCDSDYFCISVFPLWISFPDYQLPDGFDKLADLLNRLLNKNGARSKLGDVFLQKHPHLIPVKMQLLSTLASILLFLDNYSEVCDFQRENFSDLDKISQNYGFIQDIYPEFEILCQLSKDDRNTIWQSVNAILQFATPFPTLDRESGHIGESIEQYLDDATDFFVSREIVHTHELEKSKEYHVSYARWKDFSCYADMLGYLKYHSDRQLYRLDYKMAALVLIMMQGCVGQRFHTEKQSLTYLNAGETCVALLYKPLKDSFPALVELEHICRKRGYDVREMAEKFGSFIEREHPKEASFSGLGKNFSLFVQKVYELGFLLRYLKDVGKDFPRDTSWEDFYNKSLYCFQHKNDL